MKLDSNGQPFVPARSERCTFAIEPEIRSWLYMEKRRRDRSMGWLINNALRQYMERTEKARKGSEPE